MVIWRVAEDMSGLQLAVKLQLPLCMGLGSHQTLETVALAGVGLGGTGVDWGRNCTADADF